MKRILLIPCLLLMLHVAHAAEEIRFEQATWNEALAKAKAENKLVFLDTYTSWCGPCKWMAQVAFTDSEVATFYNSHFVNVSMDMEKGEGPELAKRYEVTAYPTLLFIDGTGQRVHVAVGARDAAGLLQLGQDIATGKAVSVFDLKARYEAGDRDPKFLRQYAMVLANANMDFEGVIDDCKSFMKGEALLEPENWEIFNLLFRRHDTEFGQYFLTHRAAFEARYGKQTVRYKALDLYNDALHKVTQAKDEAGYQNLKKELVASGIDNIASALLHMDWQWYEAIEDWKHFAKTVDALDEIGKTNQYNLNDAAWALYEHIESKRLLKKSLEWINASIAIEKSSANMDTKAVVLHKLGKNAEAIAAAKESIEMAKVTGEDASETEAALKEWEKE